PMVTFYDIDVDANATHYYYQIETINTCQQLKYTSNIGKTIWLHVESEGAGVMNTITFTQYKDWAGNVQKYEIYRAIGGVWESSPITQVAAFGDTTVYVDNIINVVDGDGSFCYKVVATENTFPHVGGLPEAVSSSNESCVTHSPLVYVPNAFAPFSTSNYEFKPVLTFTDPSSYLLQIYNKWGQKIFETQDLNTGWLGSVDNSGQLCQSDSYVYMIRFTSADGEEFSKSGVVTLLK
ncbi:MAG: gliding motility-associated C-terminal domain-containing protein, partial [Flavobacteriales bacterium]|nr:gliding motility-associated C-terminal domain-containing protein [Flavobacteriales bacterium]